MATFDWITWASVDRTSLLEGLTERGYNPALIHREDWDEDGYRMIVLDSKGKRLLDENHRLVTVWQLWDDPEHYEFIRDWYKEFVDDDAF